MKTIVITGAGSGIGRAIAEHYADFDTTLFLCARNEERLSEVMQICADKGAQVFGQIIDVRDGASMREWLLGVDAQSPIDMVFANAGVGSGYRAPSDEDLAHARAMFDTNIYGVLNTIDPIIPRMATRGRGQIVMIASLAGYRGMGSAPAYSASKGFVKLYGEGLRGSLAGYGVKVNVVCPGFVRSRITDQNNFKMPFFMEGAKAAQIIAKGLERNKGRIAFPWPMALASWFLSVLPDAWAYWIGQRMPNKS